MGTCFLINYSKFGQTKIFIKSVFWLIDVFLGFRINKKAISDLTLTVNHSKIHESKALIIASFGE